MIPLLVSESTKAELEREKFVEYFNEILTLTPSKKGI